MRMNGMISDHWIISLIERCIGFLFLFSIILLGLYLLGNFQDFLDRNQQLLLKSIEYCCLLGGIISLYFLIYRFFSPVMKISLKPGIIIINLLILAYNTGIYLALKLLTVWLQS